MYCWKITEMMRSLPWRALLLLRKEFILAYQLTSAASQTIPKIYWLATTQTASHDSLGWSGGSPEQSWLTRGCPRVTSLKRMGPSWRLLWLVPASTKLSSCRGFAGLVKGSQQQTREREALFKSLPYAYQGPISQEKWRFKGWRNWFHLPMKSWWNSTCKVTLQKGEWTGMGGKICGQFCNLSHLSSSW